VEEVREAWTQRWRRSRQRRSVVPMAIPGLGGEGWADGTVLGCFDVEEERGADMEEERGGGAHGGRGGGGAVEADVEEERASVGVWWGNERVRV
jgi:hypothetical protein